MTTPAQTYGIDFEVPAGTPASAPEFAAFTVPGGAVTTVRLTVPTGHNGLTGFALFLAGTAVIPYGGDSWVIASGQEFVFQVNREVPDGQLQVAGYNTGTYPHTFHVLADWVPALAPQGATAVLSTSDQTTAATDQAVGQLVGYGPDDTTDVDQDLADLDTSDLDEDTSADTGEIPAVADLSEPETPDQTTADLSAAPVDTTPLAAPVAFAAAAPAKGPPTVPAPPKPKPKPKPAPARKTVPRKK